ncbi:hypothetical protein [Bartonella sp. DGB2]|uniref:hypothetical protein n=1 Tax=Bartonella sp. DGB2 TaxID=3388426 RepID=UPI00398FC3E0
MYYAVVKDGVVVNTIVAPENYTYPFNDGAIAIPSDEAGIGWRYENGQFIPPEKKQQKSLALDASLHDLLDADKHTSSDHP